MPVSSLNHSEAQVDTQFAEDVRDGLGNPDQKQLPSRYFYNDVGSALFEAITALPEYGLTRADSRLIRRHATEMIAGNGPVSVIELGSGSGLKTRWLLESATERYGRVSYTPIDVSAFALELCQSALESIPGVEISPRNATYLDGLVESLAHRERQERVLVLFLGSTIGNFDPPEGRRFLTDIRRLLGRGDSLLLGTDLVKPPSQLVLAYDDPVGVTAAFNRNILARVNSELCGHFDLRSFEHEARWNAADSRVEMHLRSSIRQAVRIDALDRSFNFEAGETIWTESSYKFTVGGVRELARATGFAGVQQWVDDGWAFAESLLSAD